MRKSRFGQSVKKVALALTAVVMIMTTLSMVATPTADAQGATTFTRYFVVPAGTPCPGTSIAVGTFPATPGLSGQDLTFCQPVGFSVVTSQTECARGGGVWIAAILKCGVFGFELSRTNLLLCPAPFLQFTGDGVTAPAGSLCLEPLLSNAPGSSHRGVPVCIESSTVQDDSAADGLGIGSEFVGTDGTSYSIIGGEVSCKFGCDGGFDANCDDKHGDFCAVELDLSTVKGVKQCLAALNPAAAPLAEEAVASVPAAKAKAVPAATSLAYTGTESVLAYAGAALVAYGAVAMGVQRHLKVRREDEI